MLYFELVLDCRKEQTIFEIQKVKVKHRVRVK